MRKYKPHIVKKWLLLILFGSYVSAISFFTHTHVVNRIAYVHSHPFKKSEKTQHTHTENELFLLDHLYHTQITSDVVPDFNFSDPSIPSSFRFAILYEGIHPIKNRTNTLLRAPPAA